MEDNGGLLEDDLESTAATGTIGYESIQESVYSNGYNTVYDDPMKKDDFYYDMSRPRVFDGDESLPLSLHDTSKELSMTNKMIRLPKISKMGGKILEKNNNNPKNSQDLIEMTNDDGEEAAAADADRIIEIHPSPRLGCSKDSLPISQTDKSEKDCVRARQFLHLISKINYDSILSGIKKNPNFTFGEFKLCDLLPQNDSSTDSRIKIGNFSMENPVTKFELTNNAEIETSTDGGRSNSITVPTTSKVQRSPAEDIRTVRCNKSSSESEISIACPKISPPLTIMNVASTSQIAQTASAKQHLFKIHKKASQITKLTRDDETKHERKVDTTSAYRQHVQFSPVVPEIQPQSKIVRKSQIPHQIVTSLTTTVNNRGAIPKVRDNILSQEPPATVNTPQASRGFNGHESAPALVVGPVRDELYAEATATEQPAAAESIQAPIDEANDQVQERNKSFQKIHEAQQQQQKEQQQRQRQQLQQQLQQRQLKHQQIQHQQQRRQLQQQQQRQELLQQQQRQQRQELLQQQRQQYQQRRGLQLSQQKPQQPKQKLQPQQQQQQSQNSNRAVCMEIYHRLRNVFPNVDPNYIKQLCPPEWGPGDRDAQLAPLVEHLLERVDSLPVASVVDTSSANYGVDDDEREGNGTKEMSGNADDIYETLLEIFPDADPQYLREFAKKNVSKPKSVEEFIESKLEKRDYPTREQYMARLKITQQQRQYTSGFDIKHFFTIIPDPFKHFMDSNRKCQYNEEAFEFLKTCFNNNTIQVPTILRAYETARYNLSLTAADLERIGAVPMINKGGGFEIQPKDILVLQEIAFIKHKKEIKNYMENAKRQEEADFKMLKEQNFLIECACCYDTECMPSKCSSCENGHSFCNNCVINGTSSKMSDGETRISCFLNCGSEFSLSTLQEVLPPTIFSILLRKRQAAEVIEAGVEGVVACPFCHFASIPPENDKIFKCLNPECRKESCRLCKEPSHIPLKCDEDVTATDRARCYIEEKMTQALARKCYKCRRAFLKETGCNKITCPCGAIMCYLCDQPIKDYTHFSGSGRYARNLCPLYDDTRTSDAIAVRTVAEKAQKDVMKLNPNVKIDTAKLLNRLPNPLNGPLTAAVNANKLTLHAQRILDQQLERL